MYDRRPRVRLELKSPTLASPMGRLLLAGLFLTWMWSGLVIAATSRPILVAEMPDGSANQGAYTNHGVYLELSNHWILPVRVDEVTPVPGSPYTVEATAPGQARAAWVGYGRTLAVTVSGPGLPASAGSAGNSGAGNAGTPAAATPGSTVTLSAVMVRMNVLGVRVLQVIPVTSAPTAPPPR